MTGYEKGIGIFNTIIPDRQAISRKLSGECKFGTECQMPSFHRESCKRETAE